MMERAESEQKLYTRMRLWEFPDQYVVEPTDGSCGSSLAVSRVDGTMNLIGGFTISVSFSSLKLLERKFQLGDVLLFVPFLTVYVRIFVFCFLLQMSFRNVIRCGSPKSKPFLE